MNRVRISLRAVLSGLVLCGSAVHADDWPQHLGPGRNGVSTEQAPSPWSHAGPAKVWAREVGAGFSAPVIVGRCLVVFHRRVDEEVIECLLPTDGKTVWSHAYPTRYRDDFGFDEGPRAAPTIDGDAVYTFGAQGVLTAVSLRDGTRLWQVDTHRRFGVRKGYFGAAGSPLVSDDRVILNVGGADAGIVALDAASGEVLWSATTHEAGYSSGVTARISGLARLLFFTREGLAVLDPATGSVHAEMRWRARINASVNAATPLVDGDRVFLTASYRTGAVLLDLSSATPRTVWSSDESLSSHYSTGVLHDGYLYGFHGRQEYGPALRAVELATGKVRWSRDRFGAGSITRVGERLLVIREDGTLILAAADPTSFEPLAETELLPGTVRAYPAYSDGTLYVRNSRTLAAFRLR